MMSNNPKQSSHRRRHYHYHHLLLCMRMRLYVVYTYVYALACLSFIYYEQIFKFVEKKILLIF